MRKITPSTILLISFALMLISFIFIKRSNIELISNYNNLIEYNNLGLKYNKISNSWLKGSVVENKLNKIIKSCHIVNIEKNRSSKQIKVSFDGSLNQIDKFVNKILNEKFIIKQLEIKKKHLLLVVEY